jgi:3-oxoacyl-[acyl-carrier-protein] synthase-3
MCAKISAISFCFPSKKITNSDLKIQFPEYDFEKFEEKVGIKNRYFAEENETALDLALTACEDLFKRFDRNKVDYILYCTQSPDYFLPTTACILQNKLGLNKKVGALDFNLGCSGYTYGLSLAKSLIVSKQANHVLLITAETYSKYIHPLDRSNKSIFGDAATASIISYSEENDIGEFVFGTDGSKYDQLIVRNGCARFPKEENPVDMYYGTLNTYSNNHLYMNGPEIFNFTNEVIPDATREVLMKNNLQEGEIDQYIFHQANAFMLNYLRKKLGIAKDKFYIDLLDGGNTVSSTIPIALKKYSHLISKRASVVLIGFGVGLSWCGCTIQINKSL